MTESFKDRCRSKSEKSGHKTRPALAEVFALRMPLVNVHLSFFVLNANHNKRRHSILQILGDLCIHFTPWGSMTKFSMRTKLGHGKILRRLLLPVPRERYSGEQTISGLLCTLNPLTQRDQIWQGQEQLLTEV